MFSSSSWWTEGQPYALDLSLEVLEGSSHNLGDLTLWLRIMANTFNPMRPGPKVVGLYRTGKNWSPPLLIDSCPEKVQVDRVVESLRAMQWPGRDLDVVATKSPVSGWQGVELRARLDGVSGEVVLGLQYAGLEGVDAGPLTGLYQAILDCAGVTDQPAWLRGTWKNP